MDWKDNSKVSSAFLKPKCDSLNSSSYEIPGFLSLWYMVASSQFTRFSRAVLLSETVFNSDNLFLHVLKAIAS